MKVAKITGKRQAELREVPDPKIRENFVIVKIHSIPMCTEYKAYASGRAPGVLGHEAAGEVVEIAEEGASAQIDKMAKKYLGKDKYPYSQPGVKTQKFLFKP